MPRWTRGNAKPVRHDACSRALRAGTLQRELWESSDCVRGGCQAVTKDGEPLGAPRFFALCVSFLLRTHPGLHWRHQRLH